ncbi:EAL and GGDEF domain-containing protein [Thiomicrorhabdus xiamenensis]|uniref:cyclic-guanylate-specific phosphodiesterase n=1 Tax=Thiomicrorhabdus xiamenensis TaxID=2739063 RepID=A0A7D4NPY0_9GAMM|nr:EAL domain-containing protein [Thiomicrorhabdus xiamenensis]QKI88457.1 EAL domain-containing protein [Thiomicrorhabdus xiamenensis]
MDRCALQSAFFEIAVAIGNSFELDKMLNETAGLMQSRLNCESVTIYRQEETFVEICCAHIDSLTGCSIDSKNMESLLQQYQQHRQDWLQIQSGRDFYYLFELKDFGVLVVNRKRLEFDDFARNCLLELMQKLAHTIQACIDHQKLSSVRKKLIATQRVAKIGDWEFDLQANKLEWSAETYRIFECDEASYKPSYDGFWELIHPEDRDRVFAVFEKALRDKQVCSAEHRVLFPDGRIKYVFEQAFSVFDDQGNPTSIAGTIQDITEKSHIEKELNQRETELEAIVESIPLMLFVKEAKELRFVRFNKAGEKILGYSRAQMLGKNDYDFFPEEQASFFIEQDRQALNSGKVTSVAEEVVSTPSGDRILHTIKVGIPDEKGEPKYLLGISEDITEFKQANDRLQASEKYLRLAQSVAKVGHYVLNVQSGLWTSSEELDRVLGIDNHFVRDVAGWVSLIHPEDRAMMTEYFTNEVLGKHWQFDKEYRIISPVDGCEKWVYGIGVLQFDDAGQVVEMFGTIQDISERKKNERKLSQASSIITNLAEGIMVTDDENRFISINPAFTRITGYSLQEVKGKSPNILYSGRHDENFYREMWDSLLDKGHWQGEVWNRRKNGEVYPQWLSISTIRDEKDMLLNYIGVFSDISAVKESEEELRFLAHHDALTSLPNRVLLNDRLEHALTHISRSKLNLAVLYLDLDHFKSINDSFGHPHGDLLLQVIASRLQQVLRKHDTVSRVSGDEFVILLEDLHSAEEAGVIAEKILDAISKPIMLDVNEVTVTASIGIAMAPADSNSPVLLLKNADTALYRAKDQGRNNFEFFSSEMSASSFETLFMLNGLYKALDNEEFVVYYQPQVDMVENRLTGVEALVRWNHPEMGLVPPDRFIPLAEDSGVILKLGEWVLRTACRQMKSWLEQGVAVDYIAVNISGRQLIDKNLLNVVRSALQEANIDGRYIELEVTETLVMKETSYSNVIDELKALGVRISIDDFGTGYSSLVRLKYLPIDKLKIDMSFIQGVPEDEDDTNITRTIINLAQGMNLNVIAEGVESEKQAEFLLQQQCRYVQGYLYSRPLPAKELEVWMTRFHQS